MIIAIFQDYSAKLKEGVSSESADTFIKRYEEQKQKEEQKEEKKEEADNSPFPCIMAMCGSGTGIILVSEKGKPGENVQCLDNLNTSW